MPPDAEYAATRAEEWTRCRSVHSIACMETAARHNGMRIRLLRTERRIKGIELAERVGVTRQHLANVELGRSAPSLELLVKISQEFGVPLDDLIVRDAVKAA